MRTTPRLSSWLLLLWTVLFWPALLATEGAARADVLKPQSKSIKVKSLSMALRSDDVSLVAVSPARAAGPVFVQVAVASQADRERVPGELLVKLDDAPVGIVPALVALTPAPANDPHLVELSRADGAYAFRLKLAVADGGVRVVSAETLACPQVRVSATVAAAAKAPAQLRLAFTRDVGSPCKGESGRTPAGDELYKVRVEASVPAAQVYYPKVSGFLDRLLQRKVYDYVRQGPTAITLVVPYEPRDVPVIFKAPPRPDCVLNLHMEGPRFSDVTLVSGAQKLPAVAAASSQPPPTLTCVFAAGPP